MYSSDYEFINSLYVIIILILITEAKNRTKLEYRIASLKVSHLLKNSKIYSYSFEYIAFTTSNGWSCENVLWNAFESFGTKVRILIINYVYNWLYSSYRSITWLPEASIIGNVINGTDYDGLIGMLQRNVSKIIYLKCFR